MTTQSLDERIRDRLATLQPSALELIDESHLHVGHAGAKSGGKHFQLTLTAPCFKDLSLLAKHRLVYDCLGSLMHSEIHALRINARA
jgi:BolA family transcriptional regulator, general stress-responsive regulator